MVTDTGTQPSAVPAVRFYRWAISFPRGITAELRIFGQDLRREDVQHLKKELELLEDAFSDENP